MELNVQVEKTSSILRKLTIKVPAKEVANRFERSLAEVQKTAKLKGFRPGQAPISMIRQLYGADLKHRLFHNLIDESFREAVSTNQLRAVGSPKIDASNYKTGEGVHDHALRENEDFTFTATIEIVPEIEIKNYVGISLTQEMEKITSDDIEKVVESLRNSHAELIPATSGLARADGTSSSRPIEKKDHVEVDFKGGVVTETGIEEKAGMKGNRVVEIGSDSLIPGFEEQLIGLRQGDSKTFRIPFPKDFYEKDMAGKEAEFSVVIKEVKEKKLPELNEEFAKEAGYESLDDMRKKAREYLESEKKQHSDRKLRSDLIQALSEKNKFEIPSSLIEAQTQALAQEWAQELKSQGLDEAAIQSALMQELDGVRTRAEAQVRASLMLDTIAKIEKIDVSAVDIDFEISKVAKSMNMEISKLQEFYAKNPNRKEDLSFRMRQERTFKFLLDKAKIKTTS